mmetsp:Transcript_4822/g.10604  ORF Transcript_4822/g.10604 Transcript_4822/m.10604 type:complete len:201 (-) Transcript_4822:1424-2026(-)
MTVRSSTGEALVFDTTRHTWLLSFRLWWTLVPPVQRSALRSGLPSLVCTSLPRTVSGKALSLEKSQATNGSLKRKLSLSSSESEGAKIPNSSLSPLWASNNALFPWSDSESSASTQKRLAVSRVVSPACQHTTRNTSVTITSTPSLLWTRAADCSSCRLVLSFPWRQESWRRLTPRRSDREMSSCEENTRYPVLCTEQSR